jgi:hypothetical protein
MKKAVCSLLTLLSLAVFSSCRYVTFDVRLEKTRGEIPVLVTPQNQILQIEVTDNRPLKGIHGGGLNRIDSGAFLFLKEIPDSPLVPYLEKTGTETAQVLGFSPDPGGGALKITLNKFWIDLYKFSGYSPANCIGYGSLTAELFPGPEKPSLVRNYLLSYYENDIVFFWAVSRIYTQMIWETVGKTILENGSLALDPKGTEKLLQRIDTENSDRIARELIFWLGLVGRNDRRVQDKLLQIFRNTREQRRRQAAVEALGMLGVQEARKDIVDALGGTRKVGYWSNDDAEEVFYLIKALSNLGEKDLQEYIPKQDFRAREKVVELVGFLSSGKIPELHPNAKPFFEEIQDELRKKN